MVIVTAPRVSFLALDVERTRDGLPPWRRRPRGDHGGLSCVVVLGGPVQRTDSADLPADLAGRKLNGMDVDVRIPGANGVEEGAERLTRQRSDQ